MLVGLIDDDGGRVVAQEWNVMCVTAMQKDKSTAL